MSHFDERKEKSCLNCNALVHGRFCHICGQENIEPKESVWHLISHFFQDITHFDGKFFSTLKYLLFRPGFLSREYMQGRRASYLNPIRMYVFTSAVFFLLFFSISKSVTENEGKNKAQDTEERLAKVKASIKGFKLQLKEVRDTALLPVIEQTLASFEAQELELERTLVVAVGKDSAAAARARARRDSINSSRGYERKAGGSILGFSLDSGLCRTVMAYDSVQARLPAAKRDGWWRRLLIRKGIDINEKASDKNKKFGRHLLETFIHSLPQMFFLSLPMYALFLSLLYRRGKKYYYVNHAVFSIHMYCATFIFSIAGMLLVKYLSFGSEDVESIYNTLLFFGMMFYQYKCMRHFYQQRRAKTIFKFFILNLLSFIVIMLLIIAFFIISLWKV